MYETIKKCSFRVRWQLREIFVVTQWKSDCVYRTRSLGIIACSPEYADMLRENRNIIVGPISTKLSTILNA